MKKRMNIIILISLLGFTLSNCIDEFDAKIPDGGVGLLVDRKSTRLNSSH